MIVFFFLFFSFVLSANRKRNLAKKSFIGRYISINFLSLLVSSFLFGQCLDIRIHAHTLVQFILFPTRIKITDRRTAAERSSQIFFLIVEEREEEEKRKRKEKNSNKFDSDYPHKHHTHFIILRFIHQGNQSSIPIEYKCQWLYVSGHTRRFYSLDLFIFWRANRCSSILLVLSQFEYWHSAMCQFILNDLPSYQSPVVIPVCCNHIFKPQGYSENRIYSSIENQVELLIRNERTREKTNWFIRFFFFFFFQIFD